MRPSTKDSLYAVIYYHLRIRPTCIYFLIVQHQVVLGCTAQSPEAGHLILKHICPAVYAILLDGLKPHVRTLFGKMKNSVWKVVEDSAELGMAFISTLLNFCVDFSVYS